MALFQQIGLPYYEAKAIDILLRERLTPKQLSEKAGIPPGKVYSVIKSLLERGLVLEEEGRPKRLFVADPSAVVGRLIDQRQQQDEALFAQLRALSTQVSLLRSQPAAFFDIGTTIEDNERIQLRSFTEAKREVCQIMNVHHHPTSNRSSKSLWEKEIGNATGRGVRFRAIYPRNATLPSMLAALPKERFRVRRSDTDFPRIDIIDGKKVLIKLVQDDPLAFGGVLFIEHEALARNLLGIFERFWSEAHL
jgi:sugar-specific transcriptional regulator TrmB